MSQHLHQPKKQRSESIFLWTNLYLSDTVMIDSQHWDMIERQFDKWWNYRLQLSQCLFQATCISGNRRNVEISYGNLTNSKHYVMGDQDTSRWHFAPKAATAQPNVASVYTLLINSPSRSLEMSELFDILWRLWHWVSRVIMQYGAEHAARKEVSCFYKTRAREMDGKTVLNRIDDSDSWLTTPWEKLRTPHWDLRIR